MKNLNKFLAVVLCLLLLCSCANKAENNDNKITEPSETTVTTIPNTPMHTVLQGDEVTTLPEDTSVEETEASSVTEEATTQTEEALVTSVTEETQVSSEISEEVTSIQTQESVVTNENGEIVDKYDPIVFETEDAIELYEKFGISQEERSAYYQTISEECKMPILHISTIDTKSVSSKNTTESIVEIFNCEEAYKLSASTAFVKITNGVQSNAVTENGGKPYSIEFVNRQTILGLNESARCQSWQLLYAHGGVKDNLAFNIAKVVGNGKYSSDSKYVQLYINEEYIGCYLVCEAPGANPNRIDITTPENDYAGTDIGYLVELNQTAKSDKNSFALIYNRVSITDVYNETKVPEKQYFSVRSPLNNNEQLKYIERYLEVCYEIPMRAIKEGKFYRLEEDLTLTLAQEEFASAEECISQVLDIESFVDAYILNEIVNNYNVGAEGFCMAVDFGSMSKYKKLTCVSPWNFSFGYADFANDEGHGLNAARFKSESFTNKYGNSTNTWFILLYSTDWFRSQVRHRWQEIYDDVLATVIAEREVLASNISDFNKGASLTSSANSTIDWTVERIEYLNSLWGLR